MSKIATAMPSSAAAAAVSSGADGGGSASPPLLPDEMIMEVLLRLPVKPILRFRAVCRSWAALLSTEQFCSLHMATAAAKTARPPQKLLFIAPTTTTAARCTEVYTRRCSSPASGSAPEEEEGDQLVLTIDSDCGNSMRVLTPASCHGLTLLRDGVARVYYICNAATRAVTRLPPFASASLSSTGLGFDARTRRYKVVRLISDTIFDSNDVIIRCEVYTHGGGGGHGDRGRWRPATGGEVPLGLRMYATFAVLTSATNNLAPVFSSNGFLHWLVDPIWLPGPPSAWAAAVVSFSLADETFSSIRSPFFWAPPSPTAYGMNRLGEHLIDMDNQLCMVRVLRPPYPDGGCALEIWRSPDCGGSSQSDDWSMKHRVDLSAALPDFFSPLVVRVVGSTGNGSSSGKTMKEKKMIIYTTSKQLIAGSFQTKVHIYDLSSQALDTILSVTDPAHTSTAGHPISRFSLFEESLAHA